MANNYPSPCDTCEKASNTETCSHYKTCQAWKTRYLYKQKQINAYAKNLMIPRYKIAEAFTYEDPSVTRKFVQQNPCDKCSLNDNCKLPCESRLLWWDLHMQELRKRFDL